MENVIHEYVRERKQKIGVIVGTVIGNMIVIGWSKTNLKAGDNFDKGIGIDLALQRAKGVQETPSLPPQMNRQMREFKDRCMRYFQQATVLSTKGPVVKTESSEGSEGSTAFLRNLLDDIGIIGGVFGIGGSNVELEAMIKMLGSYNSPLNIKNFSNKDKKLL